MKTKLSQKQMLAVNALAALFGYPSIYTEYDIQAARPFKKWGCR
jgi:hypothetical protein